MTSPPERGDRRLPDTGGPGELTAGVVQLQDARGHIIGTGFLVGDQLLVTCAHVLASGPGGEAPSDPVVAVFVHLDNTARHARADPLLWRRPEVDDVAFLRLTDRAPAQAQPLPLGAAQEAGGHRVKTFGFPGAAGSSMGRYGYGIVGDPVRGDAGARLLQLRDCTEVTEGFSGGPVLDERTGLVIGMVDSVTVPDRLGRGQATALVTPTETLREICPDLTLSAVRPYRGLQPFTIDDARWFHGRRSAVVSVLSRLREDRRFLALLGPSGSGKSSLVQAGVLSALAAGGVPGSDRWGWVIARPATNLYAELEHAGLVGAGDGLLAAARRWLEDHPARDRLVLVIDQFEELLVAASPEPLTGLIEQLDSLAEQDQAVTVVVVLRDDFYSQLAAAAPTLMPRMERATVNVPAMLTPAELEDIVCRPAATAGLALEPDLAERIVRDAARATAPAGSPAERAAVTVLPLLGSALEELWRRRDNGRLTHHAYEQTGGVAGGLGRMCDRAYLAARAKLSPAQQALVRRVVTSLVRPGDEAANIPPTRQRRRLDQLRTTTTEPHQGADRDIATVIAVLADTRLLVTSKDPAGAPAVELAHDALIHQWGQLRQWLIDDHAFLAWRHGLEADYAQWAASTGRRGQHDPALLLGGTVLEAARTWLHRRADELHRGLVEFIRLSDRSERRRRGRDRVLAVVFACLTVVASVLGSVAYRQAQVADSQRRLADSQRRLATGRALVGEASNLSDTDPRTSLLLSLAALRVSPTAEARAGLVTTLMQTHYGGSSPALTGVRTVALSPDGRTLATADSAKTVTLWDVTHPAHRTKVATWHVDDVVTVALSPDGRTLATADSAKTVILWDVVDRVHPRQAAALPGLPGVHGMAFSPDGRTLATVGGDDAGGSLVVWNVGDRVQPQRLATRTGVYDSTEAAFSPDGRTLVTATSRITGREPVTRRNITRSGGATLWDLGDRTRPRQLKRLTGSVSAMAFSPNSRTLATASPGGIVILWDLADRAHPKRLAQLSGHLNAVDAVAFSPDGRLLATTSFDGIVIVWDVTDRAHPTRSATLHAAATAVAFSPDGRTITTAGSDGSVASWNATSRVEPTAVATLAEHTGALTAVAFSPDSRMLATASYDETVILWDVSDRTRPRRLATLAGHSATVSAVAFSPNGTTLVAVGGEPFQRVNADLWDVGDRTRPRRLPALPDPTTFGSVVSFSRDGHTMAVTDFSWSLTDFRGVSLWDIRDPAQPTRVASIAADDKVALSPDGKTLMASDIDHTVARWDLTTPARPERVATLKGHTQPVTGIAFHPQGHLLVTASKDGSAILWDVTDPARPARVTTLTGHTSQVSGVAFSPDGRTVATASGDGTAMLWSLGDLPDTTADVVGLACTTAGPGFTPEEWSLHAPGIPYERLCP